MTLSSCLLRLRKFLSFSLFLKTIILRCICVYFAECALVETCLVFFSWLDWGYGCWGGRSQREGTISVISFHRHTLYTTSPRRPEPSGRGRLPGVSPVAWTVRLRAHLPGVSPDSALPFISLSKLCSSEGCRCGQAPFHKERGVTRQALQGGRYTDIIWNSSGWEIWEVSYKHILITPTHSWIRI